jgi:tetratricopeptide (TPR) repeat protein
MPPQSPTTRRVSLEWASVWVLAATIIIATIITIPIVAFPSVPTKAFVLAVGILVTLAVWILARLSRGNIIFPPVVLLGALWLPTLAYALSALFAGGPFATAAWGTALENDTLGFMLTISALGTLTALVVRRPDHYRAFYRVLGVAAGAFVALSALVVIVGQFAPSLISPSFSLVGSAKDLATVLGFVVISILLAVRFLELDSRTGRFLLGTGVVALALLAALNISIVWVLVALVALGLFVEAVMTRRPGGLAEGEGDLDEVATVVEAPPGTQLGSRSFLIPLVVLAISLFFLLGSTLGNALASVLNTGTIDVRPSWRSTLMVGKEVYSTSPVFGSGPGTFGAEWLKYRDASLNSTVFWNVDFPYGIGFIPTSAVTTGVVGVLAWLGLIVLFLFYGVRMLIMRAPEDPFAQYVSIASFVGAAYLLAIALLDLPGPIVLALAFVSLGVFASTMRYAKGSRQWGVAFARAPRLGFVIVFGLTLLLLGSVGAAYALIERFIAVSELARANAAYSAGKLDEADKAATASLSFAPIEQAYALQALVSNAKVAQLLQTSPPPANAAQMFQSTISTGINSALTATKLAPMSYQAWVALGNLYGQAVPLGVAGAYDNAKAAFDKAVALNPTNPQLYYVLAQLDIAHKDAKAAENDLKQAIALKSDYTAAIFLLSQVLVADGNVKDALTAAEAAAYFTPNDPNILFQVGVLRAAANDLAGSATALASAVAANPNFANARYFYAAVLAGQNQYDAAKAQLEAVAALSAENASAVAPAIDALAKGENPFPPNLLTVSQPPAPAQPSAGTSTPNTAP